jgi:hypothetical protein
MTMLAVETLELEVAERDRRFVERQEDGPALPMDVDDLGVEI